MERWCAYPCLPRPKIAARNSSNICIKSWKITARLSATSAGTSKKPSTSSRRTRKSARTNKSGPLKRWKSSHTRKPRKSRTSPAPRKKKFWRLSKLHGFGGTVFDGEVLDFLGFRVCELFHLFKGPL